MTDRDRLRDLIDLTTNEWEEKDSSIIVRGGAKYMFLPSGELRSVIINGKSYSAEETKK